MAPLNREAWLESAIEKLVPIFRGHGYELPGLRVSIGWPSAGGLGQRKRVIGQCWGAEASTDGKFQLFISPLLDDPKEAQGVLATLVHEIVHTVAGTEAKHGPKFKKIMLKVGLAGKPTATHAGEDLLVRLSQIADELGAFPHSKIIPVKKPKVQTTRMLKCSCKTCEYTVRLTRKWLEVGEPICPVDKIPMPPEIPLTENPEKPDEGDDGVDE